MGLALGTAACWWGMGTQGVAGSPKGKWTTASWGQDGQDVCGLPLKGCKVLTPSSPPSVHQGLCKGRRKRDVERVGNEAIANLCPPPWVLTVENGHVCLQRKKRRCGSNAHGEAGVGWLPGQAPASECLNNQSDFLPQCTGR